MQWADDSYLTPDFKASLLEEDKKYIYDRMTKESYLKIVDLIDELSVTGLDSTYMQVTNP